LQRTTNRNNIK